MTGTVENIVGSLPGVRCAALPLSRCRIIRPYLLERADIGMSGTALFFAVPYLVSADARDTRRNLSLYAVPRDYHLYIRELGERLLPVLRDAFPDLRFALFSDHSPLAEVDGAARAGLGVTGMNGLLITPEYGSFVFIAEVVTDATYEVVTGHPSPNFPDEPPSCLGCGSCVRVCPGGCSGRDSSSCLSALTQKKGALTEDEAARLSRHSLVWGCDDCQTVCPMNRAVLSGGHDTPIRFFRDGRLTRLSLSALDGMSDADFSARAYSWRGRTVIRRNLVLHDNPDSEKED